MKHSLREILADSHVAAVTIAVLIFWSLDGAFRAIWPLLSELAIYVATAIAILGIPYTGSLSNSFELLITGWYFYAVTVSFFAAWFLSRWVYRTSPFQVLAKYRSKIIRRVNV
jgi:hypothetical protein